MKLLALFFIFSRKTSNLFDKIVIVKLRGRDMLILPHCIDCVDVLHCSICKEK